MSPASDPLALLSTTTADDLRCGNFPWLGLGIGLLVILGVGCSCSGWRWRGRWASLRAEVQRLARGEMQKLHDHDYPGKFGGIARDVNAAIERFTLATPPRSETAKKDLDAILGPAPTEPASVFDLPQSHFGNLPAAPSSPFGGGPPRPGPSAGGPPFMTPPMSRAVPGPPPMGASFAPSGPSVSRSSARRRAASPARTANESSTAPASGRRPSRCGPRQRRRGRIRDLANTDNGPACTDPRR